MNYILMRSLCKESMAEFIARCSQGDSDMERKASIVIGLADATMASIASNLVVAAGLAMATAAAAEALPTLEAPGAGTEASPNAASTFAAMALAAARTGSSTAPDLIDQAMAAAIALTRIRSTRLADRR